VTGCRSLLRPSAPAPFLPCPSAPAPLCPCALLPCALLPLAPCHLTVIIDQTMLPTIEWKDGAIVMIDQRKLPASEIYVSCKTAQEVARAIKTMVIRGAPAIALPRRWASRSECSGAGRQARNSCDRVSEAVRLGGSYACELFGSSMRMKPSVLRSAQGGSLLTSSSGARIEAGRFRRRRCELPRMGRSRAGSDARGSHACQCRRGWRRRFVTGFTSP
jgi:hypothetical protein